jgi:HlyD family secretion protein
MSSSTPGLIGIYERCVGWLRGSSRRGSRFGSQRPGSVEPITAVQVDLIGTPHRTPPAPTPGPSGDGGTTTFGQPRQAPQNDSAITSSLGSGLTASSTAPMRAWQFNQSVLLKKQKKGSSVLVWAGVGTVALLGVWAVTAPLSETIAVQGKLEPGNSTKRVDAPVPGVVEEVLVKEGQTVRKGDPLVRFDLSDPRSKLAASESVRERLVNENLVAAATLGDAAATAGLTPNQRRQLSSQAEELASRRETVRQELRKAQSRLAGNRASLTTFRNIANRYADLENSGAVSEVQVLEARNRVQEFETSVAEGEREIARLEAELVNTGALTNVELRRRVEENLRQIATLDNEIRLARQQIQYGLLTAPADGVVFDIEVSPGSVVAQGTGTSASTSSKPLMKVVPQDDLQALVYLPNTAIGFVRPGLPANLSIDAFQAGDFGTVPAEVERVGSDALTAEEQSRVLGTEAKGLYYPAVLRLKQQGIQLRNEKAPLQAGMSLTADITLRERRFINIFTSFFEDQRRNLERLR